MGSPVYLHNGHPPSSSFCRLSTHRPTTSDLRSLEHITTTIIMAKKWSNLLFCFAFFVWWVGLLGGNRRAWTIAPFSGDYYGTPWYAQCAVSPHHPLWQWEPPPIVVLFDLFGRVGWDPCIKQKIYMNIHAHNVTQKSSNFHFFFCNLGRLCDIFNIWVICIASIGQGCFDLTWHYHGGGILSGFMLRRMMVACNALKASVVCGLSKHCS